MLYNVKNHHGGDIDGAKGVKLDFSASLNPLSPPRAVKRAYISAYKRALSYPDPYCRGLICAISEKEGVPKERIICGGGASELIYAFARAARVKKAVVPSPSYSGYRDALSACGAEILDCPLKEENGFDADEGLLSFIQKEKPDAVFLCAPNNPTGRLLSPDLLLHAADLCEDTGAYLFLDECFLDLTRGESAVKLLPGHTRLFILKALTKSFSLAGVRVGYGLCGDTALLKEMSAQTDPWSVSVPAQKAGEAALLCGEKYLEKSRALIEKERVKLSGKLSELGFTVFPSDANFILFKGEAGLCEKLLKRGIMLRDCADFRGLSPGYYRVSVRKKKDNEKLVSALAEALKE